MSMKANFSIVFFRISVGLLSLCLEVLSIDMCRVLKSTSCLSFCCLLTVSLLLQKIFLNLSIVLFKWLFSNCVFLHPISFYFLFLLRRVLSVLLLEWVFNGYCNAVLFCFIFWRHSVFLLLLFQWKQQDVSILRNLRVVNGSALPRAMLWGSGGLSSWTPNGGMPWSLLGLRWLLRFPPAACGPCKRHHITLRTPLLLAYTSVAWPP